jgi:hypothetical protein
MTYDIGYIIEQRLFVLAQQDFGPTLCLCLPTPSYQTGAMWEQYPSIEDVPRHGFTSTILNNDIHVAGKYLHLLILLFFFLIISYGYYGMVRVDRWMPHKGTRSANHSHG